MLFLNRSEKRISLVVIATLVGLTLTSGYAVYWAARNHAESTYGRSLQLDLESRLRLIEYEVRQHLTTTLALRKNPAIQDQLEGFLQTRAYADGEAIRAPLQAVLSEGYSALIVYDQQGVQLESVGQPAPVKFDLMLQLPQDTYLGWQDGYIVSTRIEIQKRGLKIGTLVAQSRVSGSRVLNLHHGPQGMRRRWCYAPRTKIKLCVVFRRLKWSSPYRLPLINRVR